MIARNGTECFLSWGFGLSYKNEIEIWTDDACVTVERAFSKPPELRARIMHGKNGNLEVDSHSSCNHFMQMFNFVFNLPKKRYKENNKTT